MEFCPTMRHYWLFNILVVLVCVDLNLAFPSVIVENPSENSLDVTENIPETVIIEIVQDENSELLQNSDPTSNGLSQEIADNDMNTKKASAKIDIKPEDAQNEVDAATSDDSSEDVTKNNSQEMSEGTQQVHDVVIITTEKQNQSLLENQTITNSPSQRQINNVDESHVATKLDTPENIYENFTAAEHDSFGATGHSNETSKSALLKSEENEMSKVFEEETAAKGIECNSTDLTHNISIKNKSILTPHEQINDTMSHINPFPIDSVKGIAYDEKISQYSNKEYDLTSVFPTPNSNDTTNKNKKIVVRSMKTLKNSANTDHVAHHYQKEGTEKTGKILHPSYYHSANSHRHYGDIDDSSFYADEDDIEDFESSLQVDDNQLFIESNELLVYDEAPQSLVRTQESHSVKTNKDYVDQKYSIKQHSKENKHRETDTNQRRVSLNRPITLSRIDLELSEGKDIDYDENFSSENYDELSSKDSNKETVYTSQKNGDRRTQTKQTQRSDQIRNKGSGTQNLDSATVFSRLLRKNDGVQSMNDSDLVSESILVTHSSGASPLLITSQPISTEDLSVLRLLDRHQGGYIGNIVSDQNSGLRSTSETTNNGRVSSTQLSKISAAIQRILLNGNNAANVASTQKPNAGDNLVVIEDLDSGETIYFVENSGNIIPLEASLPASEITNNVGVVNQGSGNLVPTLLSSQNSRNANLLSGKNSATSTIQKILQNLNSPDIIITPNPNTVKQSLANLLAKNVHAANVQVTQNPGDISQTNQNRKNVDPTGIFLPSPRTSQNLNNDNIISQNYQNLGVTQNLNSASTVAVTQQSVSGPQNLNNANVIVTQSSLNAQSSQLNNNVGNTSPVQIISQNGGVILTQQTDNVSPTQIFSQHANGNILVAQIPGVGNNRGSVLIQQASNTLDSSSTSQNNLNTLQSQNINNFGGLLRGQTGNTLAIQNLINQDFLVGQNNGAGNNMLPTPQNINNLGPVPTERFVNSVDIQTAPLNANANILVNQNNGGNGNMVQVPQNINNLGSLSIQQSGNTLSIQTAPQNSNNANVLVNQNNGGNGNTSPAPQISNNFGTVTTGQTGNSATDQRAPQNSNNNMVNQNNGGNGNISPIVQNTNGLDAELTGNSVVIQNTPQNSNSNILVNQNNGGNGINVFPTSQTVNTLSTSQTVNTFQNALQNSNSIMVNQNNENNRNMSPALQNSNTLGAVSTGQSTPRNSNSILVNQNNGGNANISPAIQNINGLGAGLTGNSVSIQNTPQNSNTNILVNQNNGGNGNISPAIQNINGLGPRITGNSVSIQNTPQNSNANILVNQNSGGNGLNVSPASLTVDNLGTAQTTNTVGIQNAPQNSNNILVNQNNAVDGNMSPALQNSNNIIGEVSTGNTVAIQTILQNSNNPNTLVNQNDRANGNTLPAPQNIIGNVLVTQDSVTGRLILTSQNGNLLAPQNNVNAVVTGQTGNSVIVQTAPQNSINGNQINGGNGNPLLGPQINNNGNLIVTRDSGTGNLLLTTQNGIIIGVIRIQQTGNPLAVQSVSQNINNANIAVAQNTGFGLLANSQNVNNVGIVVNQDVADSGAIQNTNNANILVTQNGGLREALKAPQNGGVGVLSQQGGNLFSGRTPSQTNIAGNILTTLLRNNAGQLITQQFGDTLPAQAPFNDGLIRNLQSNDRYMGVSSPKLNSRDAFLNHFSRNPIALQLPGNAGFLQALGNSNRKGGLVGNTGLNQRFDSDLPNSKPFLDSNLGLPELLPNGLIAISTSGNPEFTVLPDTMLPNGIKCDCTSKLPSNVATKDKIIIVVPTEDERVYTKILSSVTSSHKQPFGKTFLERNQYANSPHPCTTPIIHKTKPYVNDLTTEYLETSPVSYGKDHPFGKNSIEVDKDLNDYSPHEKDSKAYKSNVSGHFTCSCGQPSQDSDTYSGVNSRHGIRRASTQPDGHQNISDSFRSAKKSKLYKYDSKVRH